MIQANELRIGNIITHQNKNGIYLVTVTESLKNGVNVKTGMQLGEWFLRYEEVKGTPLTEQWLLKFGFLKRDQFLVFYKKHFQVDFNIFSWETPVGQSNGVPAGEFYIIINGSINFLNTVHQLQNLFYSLTGSELVLSTVPEATKPAL